MPGSSDRSVVAFTLMQVVGRDGWIGIWAVVGPVKDLRPWAFIYCILGIGLTTGNPVQRFREMRSGLRSP